MPAASNVAIVKVKMFTKTYKYIILVGAIVGLLSLALPAASAAASPLANNFGLLSTEAKCSPDEEHPKEFNGDTDIRSCCPKVDGAAPTSMQCFFAKYLNPTVNLLAVIFGIIVTASVVAGGIQISSSAGDSGKFAKGRSRIINSLLALAGFVFLYAFLQWLIPGGIF